MEKVQKGWKDFLEICASARDPKLLSELFELTMTFNERESLAMRILIIKELTAGKKTQREIAKDLNVSIAKITRGSNELKQTSPKFLQFLKENL